jgi:multidrug resistance efflux pump
MSTFLHSSRLFVLLGVVLLLLTAAGTHYLLPHAGPATESDNPAGNEYVHCFGHVDVEGGLVALYPSQPGRVVQIDKQENESAEKDEPLLHLDHRMADERCREAEAAVQIADAQLVLARKLQDEHAAKQAQQQAVVRAAEQALLAAEAEQRRQEKGFAGGSISKELRDIAQANAGRLRAVLEGERARLKELDLHAGDARLAEQRAEAEATAARAKLEQAKILRDEHILKAPCKGTVLRLLAAVGDTVGNPQRLQPAVMFCPDRPRIIRAEVPQESAGQVRAGQPATISDVADIRQVQWKGTVASVSSWLARRRSMLLEPGQLNDVRTLECIIRLDPRQDNLDDLKIGQRVHVRIDRQNR